MACTIDHQPWSSHRLTGSPYMPRGLSPSRAPKLVVQPPARRATTSDATSRLTQPCLSCGDDSVYIKPSRVAYPASILKPSSPPASGRRSRHIGFKSEALVHHLGDLGEYLYTDYENVNFEPKPYNIYHRLARLAKLQRQNPEDKENIPPPPPPSYSFSDDMAIKSKSSTGHEHSQLVRSASMSDKDSAISFARDQSGALTMHLSVHVGKEHNPKDVLVKACTSGKKLRIIAGANQDKSGADSIPAFMRDISLPMEIESMTIRAKMDPKGFLAVEGSVKDLSRKVGNL